MWQNGCAIPASARSMQSAAHRYPPASHAVADVQGAGVHRMSRVMEEAGRPGLNKERRHRPACQTTGLQECIEFAEKRTFSAWPSLLISTIWPATRPSAPTALPISQMTCQVQRVSEPCQAGLSEPRPCSSDCVEVGQQHAQTTAYIYHPSPLVDPLTPRALLFRSGSGTSKCPSTHKA